MRPFFRVLFFGFAVVGFLGCGNVDADLKSGVTELSIINVFSLATHKQSGSCANLPIQHRYLSFQAFEHPMEGDNIFIGFLEVALDDTTNTYIAHYSERPGELNTDQTTYSRLLTGSYEISEVDKKDILTLNDLGVITPTAYGSRIKFDVKLNAPIHRPLVRDSTGGFVLNGTTRIFDDSCPP